MLYPACAVQTYRILVEAIEQVQDPNERELALIEEYALRTPEELSQVYGLKLPVLLTS